MKIIEQQINGETVKVIVPDAAPLTPPEELLDSHTTRLQQMAEQAEAAVAHADEQARAWNRTAGINHRLARGYRKALEYLDQQARAAHDRPTAQPEDRP